MLSLTIADFKIVLKQTFYILQTYHCNQMFKRNPLIILIRYYPIFALSLLYLNRVIAYLIS